MSSDYINKRDVLLTNLKELPPTELHYYFALLIAIIENEGDSEQHKHIHLIEKATDIVVKLNKFYGDVRNKNNPDLAPVLSAIEELIRSSKMQSIPQKIKKALLAVCSVLLGFTLGVIGGCVGFLGGLLSDYNVINNVINSGYGFLTGLIVGALVGSRAPDLVFQSSFERKLEYCMVHISKVGKELVSKKTHAEYEAETKQYILDTFFEGSEAEKEAAFEAFLKSEDQRIQVSTTLAGFVSATLKGNLGHHSLIAFKINGKSHIPMEYGDRKKTPSFYDQNESERIITGQKLFDMLVLDRMLIETYPYELTKDILKDYDPFISNDCGTYIQKLLIGTGQAPTQIPRFNPEVDKPIGTYIIGPIVGFFSKTKEKELIPLIPHYKKDPHDPDPIITANKWSERNKPKVEEHKNEEPSLGMSF